MKISLGIHVGHDRGAAVIKDGIVIGAISQERIDRIKYSRSSRIPFESIDALLKYLDISFNDISCVGISYHSVEGLSVEKFYQEELESFYERSFVPVFFTNHHVAHAYSAFFSSKLDDALVLVADGAGDFINNMQEAESLFVANKNKVDLVCRRLQSPSFGKLGDERNYVYQHMPSFIRNSEMSLGKKFEQITHLLGFGRGGAGKTMGLAGYGKPLFDLCVYRKNDFFDFSLKYKDLLEEFFSMMTLLGKSHKQFIRDEYANIACTVQSMLENTVLNLLEDILKLYPCRKLVLSGGVFLNCLLNQKIIMKFNLDDFFAFPAAADDGQALGSAYYAYLKYFGDQSNFQVNLPYLGISYNDDVAKKALMDVELEFKEMDDDALAMEIANRIAENKIVALHRGRTEIGPRALCHRSILANPTNPNIKDILNYKVKHREAFRPFAPTVIAEEQFKYFNLKFESNFMIVATTIKEQYKSQLPGITHVDGTSRVQAVSFESEPFVHKILLSVKEKTGFPIVVNTSFNVNNEPIVESPFDAIETFLKTKIDCLVIGSCIVDK